MRRIFREGRRRGTAAACGVMLLAVGLCTKVAMGASRDGANMVYSRVTAADPQYVYLDASELDKEGLVRQRSDCSPPDLLL
jgi:hypothetical protein